MDTEKRIAAVRERLLLLQEQERLQKRGPGCEACIWYELDKKWYRRPREMCTHIAMVERSFNHIKGDFDEKLKVQALDARRPEGLCGPAALLFEPRRRGLAARAPWLWRGAIGVLGVGAIAGAVELLSHVAG